MAKMGHRKKKQQAAPAVKIPQGNKYRLRWIPFLSLLSSIHTAVIPTNKCKLRLLKLERIRDYLLMEQEFIQNQELRKPRVETNEVLHKLSYYNYKSLNNWLHFPTSCRLK